MTTDVKLLPLPSSSICPAGVPFWDAGKMRLYALANMAPLIAENERLRGELRESWSAVDSKVGWEWKKRAEQADARAERLAEALQELVEVFSESGMYDEEVFAKARAALDQEGGNG